MGPGGALSPSGPWARHRILHRTLAGSPTSDDRRPVVTTDARVGVKVAVILAVLTAARIAYLAWGSLDLSPDEAHYWEWSRRLDLSYYSKGPLIAYLIAGLTAVFGTSALGIRLGAVGLSLVGAWALYRLGRELYGRPEPGALAVIGLQVMPLVWAGSLLMTIDAPFVVAWTLGLWAAHRAVTGGGMGAWALLGLAIGVGSLAKYAMLFALPGLVLYLWRAPERRRVLAARGPILAGLVALSAFVPVLLWNARTGWVSARHVASQGRGRGFTLEHLAEFLGSQFLVLSPLLAGLLAWGLWVAVREGLGRGREPYRFLARSRRPCWASTWWSRSRARCRQTGRPPPIRPWCSRLPACSWSVGPASHRPLAVPRRVSSSRRPPWRSA